ncbi:heavy-metal-associated domain-containing protein [Hymenobacter weizhouensis]|uniref:heavy-metal-associated domain-containing protein n=1 Tax=Hymenobacter sp. YIM 151500-1 TaxID=2987689 RepID=UPI002225F1E4|nr:heavy-metal-associated domain-containing protein [Hymenobacter sp. YIM 151500-1]UYZ64831.1 heavy-metal-associated domain-containing protein [Hymenobacter sp. YIM 151500-1]
MKTLLSFLAALCLLLPASGAFAQGTPAKTGKGTAQVQVKTSAVCDMCKARLEKSLAYEKGVQAAVLDVPSQMLTVTFRPDKTTPEALRTAVQRTGYDADTQPADARAYDRLPECCKKTNAVH